MVNHLTRLLRNEEFMKRANSAWRATEESTLESSFYADKIQGISSWIFSGVMLGSSSTSTLPFEELIELWERLRTITDEKELESWKKELSESELQYLYIGFKTDRKIKPPIKGDIITKILTDYINLHTHPPTNDNTKRTIPSLKDLEHLIFLDKQRDSPQPGIGLILTREMHSKNLTLVLYQRQGRDKMPTVSEFERSQAYPKRILDTVYFDQIGFTVDKVQYPLQEFDISKLKKFVVN